MNPIGRPASLLSRSPSRPVSRVPRPVPKLKIAATHRECRNGSAFSAFSFGVFSGYDDALNRQPRFIPKGGSAGESPTQPRP
jgi:hypothetical protein